MNRSILGNRRCRLLAVLAAALTVVGGCSGCSDTAGPSGPGAGPNAAGTPEKKEERFKAAMANLDRLEEFAADQRLHEIVKRLDEWVRIQRPLPGWSPDPLLKTLPEPLAQLPGLKGLDKLEISVADGFALREVVLLRAVAAWTHGRQFDDLSRAKSLFDWIVRNVQLESRPHLAQSPWETLLLGRGSASERAWVFVLLARQQHIDAAVLAVADPAGGPPQPRWVGVLSRENVYLFDPFLGLAIPAPDGIKIGSTGSLEIQPATLAQVVADPALLQQLDVDQEDPYWVEPADLDRLVALIEASPIYLAQRMKIIESRLVREEKMVLSTDAAAQAERWKGLPHVTDARLWMVPYETNEQQRECAIAYYQYRSNRTQASADAAEMQARAKMQARANAAKMPFNISTLQRGRVRHLKGTLTGADGPIDYYRGVRRMRFDLTDPDGQFVRERDEALRTSRPGLSERQIREMALEQGQQQFEMLSRGGAALRAELYANYWLGLIAMERGSYQPTAISFLETRTLEYLDDLESGLYAALAAAPTVYSGAQVAASAACSAGCSAATSAGCFAAFSAVDTVAYTAVEEILTWMRDGPWTSGALYNLGRCYEALGKYDEAIERYMRETNPAAQAGNVLRARWLNAHRPPATP